MTPKENRRIKQRARRARVQARALAAGERTPAAQAAFERAVDPWLEIGDRVRCEWPSLFVGVLICAGGPHWYVRRDDGEVFGVSRHDISKIEE